jgi:peroxiredoxin
MDKPTTNNTNFLPFILVGLGLLVFIGIAVYLQSSDNGVATEGNGLILPPIEVDQPAPELTLNDLDGNQVSLSDFLGQVVLLNNWATWCPPCRQEMPEFNAYYEKHKDAGFQIVAIEAGEPEAEVRAFVEEEGLEFVILLDPGNQSLITFQNNTLPNTWVIDRKGQLRLAWLGSINLPTLEKYLTPLLEE